ncbi:hypothetical protein Dpep_1046 [Dethiosulfovibrio peptidovorans DSM 11002]|uniref:Uncharacterized protein n=1 Tax=Dethiosulfovibrio peptidovorans DSM 11002 TaxID=469381 RepID=D2Z6H5_9BACT|nr:hypothetical protein [Dethiosulfovibrio peptidovorans]EFC91072.1 hypothetical protein Dpep_1046 [Dethiosulfovibrio peptidovorans DSM 11002]
MTSLTVVAFLILIVAITMTMVGKGGGNFYVVILAIAGIHMGISKNSPNWQGEKPLFRLGC